MKIKLLVCIISTLFLSGCWNYRELNELAITIGVGIDKVDDEYLLTVQTVNAKKNTSNSSNSSTPKIVTYTSTGITIQEAFRKLVLVSPKRTYANHVQILIIGEDIAKEGLEDSFDLFFRDPESRKDYLTLIAKETLAKNVLEVLTPIEEISATHIYKSLISDSEYYGVGEKISFEEMIKDYLNGRIEMSIPSVTIIGSSNEGEKLDNLEDANPNTKIILSEMAVFKDDKLLGFLTSDESVYLSAIKGVLKNTIITYECEKDKYMSLEAIEIKTSMKNKKNALEIDIDINSSANITEIYCDVDLENEETIKSLEKGINEKIKNEIIKTIDSIRKKYNTDIFGFEDLFYRNDNEFYKTIKDTWYDDGFKNLKINASVNIKLLSKGNILEVIKREK